MNKQKLNTLLQFALRNHFFPGCAVGWVEATGETGGVAVGSFLYILPSPPVSLETPYDVASLTKAVVTNSLAMWLVTQGKVSLQDPLIKYLPDLKLWQAGESDLVKRITIQDALSYTLITKLQASSLKDLAAAEILEKILGAEVIEKPGVRFEYQNLTSVLLGLIIEQVVGERLDQVAERVFFGPLGMSQTEFRLEPRKTITQKIPPTEEDPWRGRVIQGEVHDESAWQLQAGGHISGGAGLFSSVTDLLKFMRMLLEPEQRLTFFSEEVAFAWSSNQLPHLQLGTGLGWELDAGWMGRRSQNQHLFGKTGFTGCMLVGDQEKQRGLVMLSNHTWPRRRPDKAAITQFRQQLTELWQDL